MPESHLVGGINLLDMVPMRTARFGYNKKGMIIVYMPRFRSRFGRKMCRILNIPPYIRIHLDHYGTYVWSLCNGKFTVREISERLKRRFGNEVEHQHYERLAKFLATLEVNGLIRYL